MPGIKLLIAIGLLLFARLALAGEPSNPLLLNHSLYVSEQGVYKFNADTLEQLWSSLTGVETFAPVASGQLILVGSTQGLYALNSDDGEIAWHIEKNRSIFSPVVAGQIFAGSLHGELYAINPADGGINWRRQFSGWIYSPAVEDASGILWSGGQQHTAFSLSMNDGSLLREYPTPQELVFSPVNLGNGQIAFNLFDGSTMIVHSRTGDVIGSLGGNVQPKDIYQYGETIYRSDRGGGLSAFSRDNLALLWTRPLVSGDLDMHPSLPGFLLLSDRNQSLILFDLQQNDEVQRLKLTGKWLSPIQINSTQFVYFKKLMQPPWILAVQSTAQY